MKSTTFQIRCLVPAVMTRIYRQQKMTGPAGERKFQAPQDYVNDAIVQKVRGPLHRFEERIL